MFEDRSYKLWIGFVREALSCLDLQNYNWVHLPNAGGYYNQDEFLIMVWECIRTEYIRAIKDDVFMQSLRIKNKVK